MILKLLLSSLRCWVSNLRDLRVDDQMRLQTLVERSAMFPHPVYVVCFRGFITFHHDFLYIVTDFVPCRVPIRSGAARYCETEKKLLLLHLLLLLPLLSTRGVVSAYVARPQGVVVGPRLITRGRKNRIDLPDLQTESHF